MPHVAETPTDLLARLGASAHVDERATRRRRPGGVPRRSRSATWPGRRRSPTEGPTVEPGAVADPRGRARRWAPGRRASTSCTWPAPGARSWVYVPGAEPSCPGLRHGADRLRDRRIRRRRSGDPRACQERADLHVPATDRLLDVSPRRGDRRRLGGPGLHPGRPLPVQRQEVRRRPGGDDGGDPAGVQARDRCRLSQHRHRLVDARRPLEADRRRAAARELHAGGGADRADPVTRG